ncbi:MAG: SpoIIE family protein phosphatase, partial [Lachnospiraceae bacterium]|nr:SpoIIE family protein phosphatase [Lachnospiraceae bacterium]
GGVVGVSFYRQNIETYRSMAYSYVDLAVINISGSMISRMIEREDDICAYHQMFREAVENEDSQAYQDNVDSIDDPELEDLFRYWSEINWFVLSTGNLVSDTRYFYVVIPTEKDLIYLWDSDMDQDKLTAPFEHDEYENGEKENLMKAFRGEWDRKLAIYREEQEILGTAMEPITDENGEIVAVACLDLSITSIRHAYLKMMRHLGILVTLILLGSGLLYFSSVQKNFIKPIQKLEKATASLVSDLMSGKDTVFQVDVHTGDEIEALARSFENMDCQLKAYIEQNAQITAERERISTELDLARRIQSDMLPGEFPPFPERTEFEIYAGMHPAKEVGGDFYDFFLIDEKHLGLVIADVSGKGVPAALFMMMSKIMVQNFALSGLEPAKVLEIINEQICKNNKEQMFVTVWLGVLDLDTGLLSAANAGHEYPILKMPDGQFEMIRDKHGVVIGGIEHARYKNYTLQLEPGAKLFVYTDGLTEATNEALELFGMERILRALNEVPDGTPEQILEHVQKRMDQFVGSEPQFDDLTMMCLSYVGPGTSV